MEINKIFGERIFHLRTENHITQKEEDEYIMVKCISIN